MDAIVIVELGMECHAQLLAVLYGYDVAFACGQHFAPIAYFGDEGSTDEGHGHVFEFAERAEGMKAA